MQLNIDFLFSNITWLPWLSLSIIFEFYKKFPARTYFIFQVFKSKYYQALGPRVSMRIKKDYGFKVITKPYYIF